MLHLKKKNRTKIKCVTPIKINEINHSLEEKDFQVLSPLNCHVDSINYSVAIINKDVIILRRTHATYIEKYITLCDYMCDTTQVCVWCLE